MAVAGGTPAQIASPVRWGGQQDKDVICGGFKNDGHAVSEAILGVFNKLSKQLRWEELLVTQRCLTLAFDPPDEWPPGSAKLLVQFILRNHPDLAHGLLGFDMPMCMVVAKDKELYTVPQVGAQLRHELRSWSCNWQPLRGVAAARQRLSTQSCNPITTAPLPAVRHVREAPAQHHRLQALPVPHRQVHW